MVVSLWRRGNRCRAAMGVQTLRRGTPRILGYRLVGCHLLGDGALRLALGQRRQRAIAGPEARAAIGGSVSSSRRPRPTLARRCSSDSRVFCGCSSSALAAGLPDFRLGRHRKVLELRHPRGADRRTFGRLRDEGLGHHRLFGLDAGDVVIREQSRLLRDRANRDVAIGGGLQRRLGAAELRERPPRQSRPGPHARRCWPCAAGLRW